ncbi:MAG TPA: hypothetical protein VGQ12_08675 [Candidatus Angelobacter sp.]|jgi:hypothetical protein|nr:hypothetical protein [Candidatus Angelobacter sp.]
MSARITTEELLQAVGSTYQSIDIRSVALREGNKWINVLTVVRFSRDSQKAVSEKQEELQRLHGIVTSENFRVVFSTLAYSEWRILEESCTKGSLKVGEIEIHLLEPVKLEEQRSDIRRHQNELRSNERWPWPAFQVWAGSHHPEKLHGEALGRELGGKGWSSPYDAINSLCEINMRQGGSYGYDLFLSLPVYASVQEAKFSTTLNELQFSYIHHTSLTNTKVVAIWKKAHADRTTVVHQRILATFSNQVTEKEIQTETGCAILVNPAETDQAEIKVFHDKIGEIDSVDCTIRYIIPVPERNILFAAVKRFCPQSQLENSFIRPYSQKAKKLKESAAFELHVSWLLSIYGFSPIVLGEYEQIADETTRVNRASVDILAGLPRNKGLLVAACTIGTPKEEDFLNLHHACEILSREVFLNTSVAVYPVLFTGALNMPTCKEIGEAFTAIPVVDSDRMAVLMEHLQAGLEVLFLEFIGNPRLCGLRSLKEDY